MLLGEYTCMLAYKHTSRRVVVAAADTMDIVMLDIVTGFHHPLINSVFIHLQYQQEMHEIAALIFRAS